MKNQPKTEPRQPDQIISALITGKAKRPTAMEMRILARHVVELQVQAEVTRQQHSSFRSSVQTGLEALSRTFNSLNSGAMDIGRVARRTESRVGAQSSAVAWERAGDFVANMTDRIFPDRCQPMAVSERKTAREITTSLETWKPNV